MRKKKLLSAVMAALLVATQITMPVMAAGGSVDATITTKTPVLRVAVPTKLEVGIDEFDTARDGSQIYSENFTMTNYSTIPVKVETKSVVVTNGAVTFAEKKDDVKVPSGSTTAVSGNAWLAVAAQIAKDSYGTLADLTEESPNVATVATSGTESSVTQTFYLKNADGAKGTPTIINTVDGVSASQVKKDLTYAEGVFALSSDSSITDDDSLKAAFENDDNSAVYAVSGSGKDKTIEKVTEAVSGSHKSGYSYYVVERTTSAVSSGGIVDGKEYVFEKTETKGEETAFRFIGKLLTGREGGWTKDNSIASIKIVYTIDGVLGDDYKAVQDKVTYGLYNPDSEGSIFSFTALTAENNEVVITGGAETANVSKVVVVRKNGTEVDITANTTGASTVSWMIKTGANNEKILKISATIVTNTNNAGGTIKVTFDNGKEGTLTIPE